MKNGMYSTIAGMAGLRLLSVALLMGISFCISVAQIVVNGDFEQGRGHGWTEYSSGGYAEIGTGAFFSSTAISPDVMPRSGDMMARLGGYSYEVNAVYQTVTLPNATPLYLRFFAQTRSANTSECAGLWVGATVYVIINGQVIDSSYLCQYNDLTNWTLYYVNMSALAGQSATIAFKAASANSVWSYIYLDDISIANTTGVGENQLLNVPQIFQLQQNYPNPFNPTTRISYTVAHPGFVSLKVFDVLGKELAVLVDETKPSGTYAVTWDAGSAPGGVYFYRLYTGNDVVTRKMTLVR